MIKTILIPTDFSDVSKNTAKYAVKLTQEINAKLVLLHVFNVPVYAGDDPVFIPPYDILEKSNFDYLKEFEKELREKYAFTNPIESIARSGFLIGEINDIIVEKNIDLIIMGIHEAGKLSELVFSSHSIGVIKNTNCPTLIIPKGVIYQPINTIVFACDNIEKIENSSALKQIAEFVKLFKSKLIILNVLESFENLDFQKTLFEAKNKIIFENLDYSVHFIENGDLVSDINNFIKKNNVDLLIMIPRKHSVFSKILHESSTKKMAFHSPIPLLALHE